MGTSGAGSATEAVVETEFPCASLDPVEDVEVAEFITVVEAASVVGDACVADIVVKYFMLT